MTEQEKEKFLARMRKMNERDLEDARAASDAKTLSERADEAVAWYLLNVADMVRRARDEKELEAMFSRDVELPRLSRVWAQRHGRAP